MVGPQPSIFQERADDLGSNPSRRTCDFMIIKYSRKSLARICKTATNLLNKGMLIVYPTDTVYGIGANATNKKAVEKLFKIKHRSKEKSISVLVSSFRMLENYAKINPKQRKFLEKRLPGKYTFVLKPKRKLPVSKNKIGFRIPHHWCYLISKEFGRPITTTSANLSGEPIPKTIREIRKTFGDEISLYIDSGILSGKPSKVIDITFEKPKVLRE